MKPAVLKDEEESTVTTRKSIATAEKLVGAKMAEPEDPKQQKLIAETPEYHLHSSEEEDDETRDTRRSVKWVEKRDQHRFWINAREKRDFESDMAAGKVNPKQLTFSEDDDEDLGKPDAKDVAAKKLAKEKAVSKAKEDEEGKSLSVKDKEVKKVEAAKEEAAAKSQYEMDLEIAKLKAKEAEEAAKIKAEEEAKKKAELAAQMEKEALERYAQNVEADGNTWTASMPESALSRSGHAPLKWANVGIQSSSSSSSSSSESD